MEDDVEDTDGATGSGGLETSGMLCDVRLGVASMSAIEMFCRLLLVMYGTSPL